MVFTNNNFNKIFNFYKKNGFIKDPMFFKNCNDNDNPYCDLINSISMYKQFFDKFFNYKLLTYYV